MTKAICALLFMFFTGIASAQDKEPFIHCEPVYIIITDTSKDYNELYPIMMELSKKLSKDTDTLKQYFPEKNIVGLGPDNDPLVVGKYVRRSLESRYLSIEYISSYDTTTNEPGLNSLEFLDETVRGTTMCLIAGIYSDVHLPRAQEELERIRAIRPNAFMIMKKDLSCFWVRHK